MAQHKRFKTLADMTAFAVEHAMNAEGKVHVVDVVVYNEDSVKRPSIVLAEAGKGVDDEIHLRWYAYADENDISFFGRRAAVEAREKGEWIQNYVQEAINAAYRKPKAMFKHADLNEGDIVSLTGCNGTWTVTASNPYAGVQVQPENPDEARIWVGIHEVTAKHDKRNPIAEAESAPAVEYIDMTPTWEEIAGTLFAGILYGNSTAQNVAHGEMKRMARLADMAAIILGGKRRPDAPMPNGQTITAIVHACKTFIAKHEGA